MDWTGNIKNHEVQKGLLALTKTRLKKNVI